MVYLLRCTKVIPKSCKISIKRAKAPGQPVVWNDFGQAQVGGHSALECLNNSQHYIDNLMTEISVCVSLIGKKA